MVMKQLYINGVGTGNYDIYISSDTFLNSPEIAYEAYEVPGLDGSLLKYDKRLNNVIRRFDCFCKNDVYNNITQFKKWIYENVGYMLIESDYEPNVYQYGYLAEGIEFELFDASGAFEAKFSIYFSCKPQKYYATSSGNKNIGATDGFENVLPRSSQIVQQALDQIPISALPSDDRFILWRVSYPITPQTITNITASNSAGGFVCLFYRLSDYDGIIFDVIGYSNEGSVSVPSYVVRSSAQGRNGNVYMLTSVTPIGSIAASLTLADSSTQSISANPSAVLTTLSETNAFGGTFTVTLSYSVDGTSSLIENSAFIGIGKRRNNVISTFSGMVHFELMPSTVIDKLRSIADSHNRVAVIVDNDFNVYVDNSGTRINLVPYSEIYGELSAQCDALELYTYSSAYLNTGSINIVQIAADWWLL